MYFITQVKFSEDLGMSSDASSRLVLFMGISIVIGRFVCGFVASLKCLDNWFVLQGVSLIMGVSIMLVTLAQNYEALVSYALVFGFCDGALATIFNILCMTCVDQARVASAFGYLLFIGSVLTLAGPPVSGRNSDILLLLKKLIVRSCNCTVLIDLAAIMWECRSLIVFCALNIIRYYLKQ